jgi:hypothetical protein
MRNQEIFDYFIDLAWLISQRPIEYNYSVGLTPIELKTASGFRTPMLIYGRVPQKKLLFAARLG